MFYSSQGEPQYECQQQHYPKEYPPSLPDEAEQPIHDPRLPADEKISEDGDAFREDACLVVRYELEDVLFPVVLRYMKKIREGVALKLRPRGILRCQPRLSSLSAI